MKFNTIYFLYLIMLLLLYCPAFINSKNYYTVIAPGEIKSNRIYTVAVTLHDSSAPCTIRLSVVGRSFNVSDTVQLQPFESKKVDFFPPKLEMGDYLLLAEGLKGCEFRNESKLYVDSFAGPKIYIQTDKSVYKPEDLVQFRVVILDEHTRPLNILEPIRVEIFDNAQNRVKQFKDITLNKGVYTGEFQLSQQPVMGQWEIRVTISGKYSHQNSKKISVQLYTLPKFSVYIEVPGSVLLADPCIKAEIYGKYTFDKYVEGILTVELRDLDNDVLLDNKTLHIDGLVVVEFCLQDLQNMASTSFLKMLVMLEEKHTGKSRSDSEIIAIQKESYRITIPYQEMEFRNSRPFRLKAYVQDWNDGPIRDTNTPVKLKHGDRNYETYLNDKGVAVFEFEPQQDAAYIVMFKDSKQVLPNILTISDSTEEVYCKLTLKEDPRLGKPVQVEVKSSFNLPYLVYTVVGHSSIVRMELVKLPSKKSVHTITIMPAVDMIPESYLYVHYVLDGNLRYEEMTLKFPMELENKISISAPKQVKPGQAVTLSLQAEPMSYVSVLAVDLGVYLLDKDYDLYKRKILVDLYEDKSYVHESNIDKPGIISGLVTLTNAHYPIFNRFITAVKGAAGGKLDFRKKFPETWIFENFEINQTSTEIVLNIPETITTWRITAFSNNPIKGFGIVDGPTDITTFLPFFVTLNLPYSVKRDEIVTIPVTIFNYHNHSLETEVKLLNQNMEFHFMEPLSKYATRYVQVKSANIPANGGKTIKFLIKPLKTGEMELRIAANNSLFVDGVVQKLKVEPEGIRKYQNKARYLSAAEKESSLTLDLPVDSVSESEFITLSVGGDFMIPTLNNLKQMVKLPTGCGEQNMVNFAPNVLILDYLKANGKYSKERKVVSKAKYYIDIGYQQELSYRHGNAGYSVFGEKYNDDASTWLTAYVMRFFIKASKYTAIESRIIDSGLEYLTRKQLLDGSFPYTGYLFYKQLKNKHGFTAFVLLTFMEDRKYSRKYQNTIRKGLEYITSDLDAINDIYALSIVAAALSKAKHSSTSKVTEKLQTLRTEDKSGLVWWKSNGNEVETTAYVLMSLLNAPGNHLPILKWLIKQRNEQGGFKSTHDTVVGLEALVKFAQKYNNANAWDLKITYSAQDLKGNELKIDEFLLNQDNALTLQQHELPKTVRRVNFQITGNGYSLVQLSSQYNVKNDAEIKHFIMKTYPTIHNEEEMDLEICFTYNATQAISNSTNMVIMEVNLPSGFKVEAEFSSSLVENEFIQRIETKNDETAVVLYFDKLSTDEEHCVNIESFRANEVKERKPAALIMYDYYNTSRFNSVFYTI